MTPARNWASTAIVHTHAMAAFRLTIDSAYRRQLCRTVGDVTYLPPPIAGYRIRLAAAAVIVEIKPSHAPAVELARCADVNDARSVLALITAEDRRPFLGEIRRAAA